MVGAVAGLVSSVSQPCEFVASLECCHEHRWLLTCACASKGFDASLLYDLGLCIISCLMYPGVTAVVGEGNHEHCDCLVYLRTLATTTFSKSHAACCLFADSSAAIPLFRTCLRWTNVVPHNFHRASTIQVVLLTSCQMKLGSLIPRPY